VIIAIASIVYFERYSYFAGAVALVVMLRIYGVVEFDGR